jgi:TatD DNase family protein
MANVLVYELYGKIYINLTNRCTNNCVFCLRNDKDDVCGQKLWLDNEDYPVQDVIDQLNNFKISDEVIFCGYGEPLLKLDVLKEVAKYIKENYKNVKIRVNTNGQANIVYKRNIVPELKGLVDEFSVSLNGEDNKEYNDYSRPRLLNAYEEVKRFIKACSDENIEVVASVVEGYKGQHLNLKKCEEIANSLGAKFRAREWIPAGYS